MKEKKLKIIIGLMSAAILGLIMIQLYWMNNLIKVEEERFARTVSTALTKVSEKLEKTEAAKLVIKKTLSNKGDFTVFLRSEDEDSFHWQGKSKKKTLHELPESEENIHIIVNQVSSADSASITTTSAKPYVNKINSNYTWVDADGFKGHNDSLKYIVKSNNKSYKRPTISHTWVDTLKRKKKVLVDEVVSEIINYNQIKPIKERISPSELESTLKKEFLNRGLDTTFIFGVLSLDKDTFSYITPNADEIRLRKSNLTTFLFPDDFIVTPSQLIVEFPNQNRIIFNRVALMLTLSIGLITLIVYVFYKTVQMFIKQKKLTEVKNDLINNITHEFKTPISTISLACEALNEPVLISNPDSISRYSKIINEENQRLRLMVDTLLNTAALEKEDLNFHLEKVDIHRVIDSAISNFTETLKQKNGRIVFNANAESSFVMSDKFHLTNIISNLIDNAIKYNQNDPIVTLETFTISNELILKISDNGIGISKEHLKKIFDSFYRVQTGNIQDVRGNGIGLSYAKKIIEKLGGQISVESEPNKGAIFTIQLPICDEQS